MILLNGAIAEVYTFIPSDHLGVAVSEASADALFADDLSHWEQAINGYLEMR